MGSFSDFVEKREQQRRPWLFGLPIQKAKRKGRGRGHHGHKGRPGKVGGSLPDSKLQVKLSLLWDMENRSPKSAAGVKEMVGRLPRKHQEIASKWKFEAIRGTSGPEEEDVPPKGAFLPLYVDPKARTVSAYRGDWVRRRPAIYHELGHLVFDAEKDKSLKEWTYSLAQQMVALGRRHTGVKGRRNKSAELFSDAYELFFSDKTRLKKMSPEVFAFVENVVREAE